MGKILLISHRTKYLFMVYDDKQCFYVVSVGRIKINKNGDITSKNVLYTSKHLKDCLNYFDNGVKNENKIL